MNVRFCGVPAVKLSVVGATVTPTGNPETETLTAPLNPFTAVAVTAVAWPSAPVVSVRLVGSIASEKSGGAAAVTLTTKLAVCESEPDVPVTVTVPELVAAVAAAVNVIVCVAPGLNVTEAGVAVTPAGSPVSVTATGDENPWIAATEIVTVCPAAPPVKSMVDGVAVSEKSSTALELELHPPRFKTITLNANNQQLKAQTVDLFAKARVVNSMRLLLSEANSSSTQHSMAGPCGSQFVAPHNPDFPGRNQQRSSCSQQQFFAHHTTQIMTAPASILSIRTSPRTIFPRILHPTEVS